MRDTTDLSKDSIKQKPWLNMERNKFLSGEEATMLNHLRCPKKIPPTLPKIPSTLIFPRAAFQGMSLSNPRLKEFFRIRMIQYALRSRKESESLLLLMETH